MDEDGMRVEDSDLKALEEQFRAKVAEIQRKRKREDTAESRVDLSRARLSHTRVCCVRLRICVLCSACPHRT
jgi:hypothetical protein